MMRLEKQDYLGKSKDELIEDLFEKIRENEKLKKKLRKYENPHTPPSKDERLTSRSNFVSKTGLPVGKKTGYKGATREKKQPTNFTNNFDGVCKRCGKHNKPKEILKKIYEEISKPQPTSVVEARWGFYECHNCGFCWESKHKDTPEQGIIGKNAQAYVTLLRFDDRLPLRKTVESIDRQQGTLSHNYFPNFKIKIKKHNKKLT